MWIVQAAVMSGGGDDMMGGEVECPLSLGDYGHYNEVYLLLLSSQVQ